MFRKMHIGSLLLISIFTVACSLNPKSDNKDSIESLTPRKGDQAQPITKLGQNRNGRFSPTGRYIIFHSSHRTSHKNSQIYLLDTSQNKEKRISYHDGQTASAQFTFNDQNIIYASTTDEIKEYPTLLQEALEGKSIKAGQDNNALFLHPTLPYEIYTSSVDGSRIRRLTRHKGYDGSIFWNPTTKRLFFTSLRRNRLQLYSLQANGRRLRKHLKWDENIFDARFNPASKKWTWTQYSKDFQSSKIFVAEKGFRKKQELKLPSGLHWSPQFSKDGELLIFSSQSPGTTGFNLFAYRLSTGCIETLTDLPGHEFSPDLHPYQNELIFTYKTSLETQIYKMSFNPNSICQTQPSPPDQNVNQSP